MIARHAHQLAISLDAVLRAQGADPRTIRTRHPRLVEVAEQALAASRHLLEPRSLTRKLQVTSQRHETLFLEGGFRLSGRVVTQHLLGVEAVVAIVCTIGPKLEQRASEVMNTDPVLGLAIDGVGSAAVEAVAQELCQQVEARASSAGRMASTPLSPGMEGWPVEAGQPVLFDILDPQQIGVHLTASCLMLPRKSLTLLIGLGEDLQRTGTTCDYCTMKTTCRYQDHSRDETLT